MAACVRRYEPALLPTSPPPLLLTSPPPLLLISPPPWSETMPPPWSETMPLPLLLITPALLSPMSFAPSTPSKVPAAAKLQRRTCPKPTFATRSSASSIRASRGSGVATGTGEADTAADGPGAGGDAGTVGGETAGESRAEAGPGEPGIGDAGACDRRGEAEGPTGPVGAGAVQAASSRDAVGTSRRGCIKPAYPGATPTPPPAAPPAAGPREGMMGLDPCASLLAALCALFIALPAHAAPSATSDKPTRRIFTPADAAREMARALRPRPAAPKQAAPKPIARPAPKPVVRRAPRPVVRRAARPTWRPKHWKSAGRWRRTAKAPSPAHSPCARQPLEPPEPDLDRQPVHPGGRRADVVRMARRWRAYRAPRWS